MIETRITKVVMVASLALFALLVTFDNLTDYDTNYAFVSHVLSMDTTFPGNALLYRRITSPALWQVGYVLIIVGRGAVRHCPGGRGYLSCLAPAR
jgi:predicted small integral membrane protein